MLHYLIPPTTKKNIADAFGASKTQKYTVLDSQSSFLMCVKTAEGVQEEIKKRIEKKIPIQPFVIIVGNLKSPTEILVYFDEIKYKCTTIIKAIDICFKIFHVFGCKYPSECAAVWTFFQTFFYKIRTKFDTNYLACKILSEKLKQN